MRRRIWLVVGGLVAGLMLGACGGEVATPTPVPPTLAPPTPTVVVPTPTPTPAPTATPTVAPSPTPAATATTPPAAPAARTPAAGTTPAPAASAAVPPEVARAVQAFSALKSYRMRGPITSTQIGTGEVLVESVAPDRMLVSITGEQPGQAAAFIRIGQAIYVKFGDAWLKMDEASAAGAIAPFMGQMDARELLAEAGKSTYTPAGNEVVEGEPCVVFDSLSPEGGRGKIWIATRDDIPRKWQLQSPEVEMTVTISDINAPITIEAPI